MAEASAGRIPTLWQRSSRPTPRQESSVTRKNRPATHSHQNSEAFRRISSVVNHTPASASRPLAAPSGLQEGQTIEHERFGIGTVVKLEGTGENQKATVEFSNSGTKQLLLKFARFKVIK